VKTTHALTKTNYGLFCDYDIVLGLAHVGVGAKFVKDGPSHGDF
jgi:hypothetical protein